MRSLFLSLSFRIAVMVMAMVSMAVIIPTGLVLWRINEQIPHVVEAEIDFTMRVAVNILQPAIPMAKQKLAADGSIERVDGLMVAPRVTSHTIADEAARLTGGHASVYRFDPAKNTFVTTTTSIMTPEGKRAIGLTLSPGAAFDALLEQSRFMGTEVIGSDVYYVRYEPVRKGEQLIGAIFVAKPAARVTSIVDSVRETQIILGFAAMVLASGLAFFVMRRAMRPIPSLARIMELLSRGDLTLEVPHVHQRDEIGRMAQACEIFRSAWLERDHLRVRAEAEAEARQERARRRELAIGDFRMELRTITDSILDGSQIVDETASVVTQDAEQTRQLASSASGALSVATRSVEAVAAAAEELGSSINEIAERTKASVVILSRAAATSRLTDTEVTQLSKAVEGIGVIIKVIREIAEQTNLIALNATIEAARAGEAGRGFLVVASEVKSLANQTSKATEEIVAQISGIQLSTVSAAESIRQITDTLSEVDRYAGDIAAAISQQASATSEISRAAAVAARETTSVLGNMTEVKEATIRTSTVSHQLDTLIQTFTAGAKRLDIALEQFAKKVGT